MSLEKYAVRLLDDLFCEVFILLDIITRTNSRAKLLADVRANIGVILFLEGDKW